MLCRTLDTKNMQCYLGDDGFNFDGSLILDDVGLRDKACFEYKVYRREIFPRRWSWMKEL